MTPSPTNKVDCQVAVLASLVNSPQALIDKQQARLEAVKKKMKVDKQKYSQLGNSQDMSTAIKRKSLKGAPLKQRIYFGGNFNINSTDPVILDFSPQLGYYLNRKWIIGAGFTYRNSFSSTDSTTHDFPTDAHNV